jgi:hypothetical protein
MSDQTQILERLQAKDSLLFALSDTLDVKSSIVLVVVTFLATQTADFLTNAQVAVGPLRYVQVASAFALALSGTLALASLWPRDHEVETAEQFDEWEQQLREHYKDAPDPEQAVAETFQRGRIQRLKERIAANDRVDRQKSRLVALAYTLAGVALLLNMGTLLALALS